jgi:tRNA-dihydrouridine synthase
MIKDIFAKKKIIGLSPMDGVTDCAYREIMKKYGELDLLYTEFQNVHGLALAVENLWEHMRYTEFQRPIIAQIYGHEIEYFFPSALICLFLGFDGVDINMGCPAKGIADRGAGAGLIRTPAKAIRIIEETKRARQVFFEILNKFELRSTKDIRELLGNPDKAKELEDYLFQLPIYSPKLENAADDFYGEYVVENICQRRNIDTDIFQEKKREDQIHIIQENISWKDLKVNWKKLLEILRDKLENWDVIIPNYFFEDSSTNRITVSLKTRIGYEEPNLSAWISQIIQEKPDFIAIHGRTLKQLYTGTANWAEIGKGIKTARELGYMSPILANGDIKTVTDAVNCLDITAADGLLVGRGSYGDPLLFEEIANTLNAEHKKDLSLSNSNSNIIPIMLEHAKLFEKFNGERGFFAMRKNLAWYIRDMPNAVEIRKLLVQTNSSAEIINILKQSKLLEEIEN